MGPRSTHLIRDDGPNGFWVHLDLPGRLETIRATGSQRDSLTGTSSTSALARARANVAPLPAD